MPQCYTLHTDESGEFEGAGGRKWRHVAGLILPEMSRSEQEAARRDLLSLAQEWTGESRFAALHAGTLAGSVRARDQRCASVVSAVLRHVPRPEKARLVLLSDIDARKGRGRGVLSVSFAANLYQRMLVELVRQCIEYAPAIEAQSTFDLHLASRVFPAAPDELPRLQAMGYARLEGQGRAGGVLVQVGKGQVLHAALQTRLGAAGRDPRSSVRRIRVRSIGGSKDPRFVAADFLANYAFRHAASRRQRELTPNDFRKDFPSLAVSTLRYGPALETLSLARDALEQGDPAGALELLSPGAQPQAHERLVGALLLDIASVAARRMRRHPELADRLLDRAERILSFRRYGLMSEAERLAQVVVGVPKVAPQFSMRAHEVLGTVANHRGEYAVAARELESAIEAAKARPPTLTGALTICDLENRRAVSEMNVFRFDLQSRLDGRLELVERMVEQTLGKRGRERIAGELAGTLAQAAAFRGDRNGARAYFARAAHHLGEDHMQAAFRAHAAVLWGQKASALKAASEALGSTYGVEGYDRAEGQRALDNAARTFERDLVAAPFNAWLVTKLAVRGWVAVDDEGLDRIERVLEADTSTHHPHMLIALDGGRLLASRERLQTARAVWQGKHQQTEGPGLGPTLSAIRTQITAELARAQLEANDRQEGERHWARTLKKEARGVLSAYPELEPHFGACVHGLQERGPEALDSVMTYLGRFTFLYT